MFLRTLVLLCFLSAWSLQAAAVDEICPICGDRMGQNIYRFTRRGSDEKVLVCENCAKLDTGCFICGLPVKHKYMRLADGRLLCDADAKTAILQQNDMENIFDDVKRDLQSMLAQLGSLPHYNIHVVLDAKARLDKSGADLISAHDDRLLMGLTRTVSREPGKFEHEIHLLYGLTRERMMAVAAHEYAHTWLHENVRRKLNQDTVEGFCDWIAYKLISQKSFPYETKVLLDSDYSRGQLQAYIVAEKEHGFYHVMQWVKHGVDPEADTERLDRILSLREDREGRTSGDSAPMPFAFAPVPPRAAPTNLLLKGLSGSKSRRFALINDGTFQANEQGKVRLGDSNVTVRCLQILDDAVIIHVAGEAETRTLKLNAPR